MLARILSAFGKVRQFFSRSEWTVRWLQLSREPDGSDKHGLVIVQIDGLSHRELNKALSAGRMPFLSKLLEREHYRLVHLYSGLPSSTPAVQGELFYRKRCAVPAFGFRDHRDKVIQRMFNAEIASRVEQDLAEGADGLLKGGSSYCNIYGGGANEVHFCASSLGWGQLFRHVKSWRILLVSSFYWFTAVRTMGLLIVEFILAVFGFFRGFNRREFWQELMMIPGRVVVSILLRELAINGAIMDTVRGLPIIYLNLLGYDEQAHRRRPDSRFAHWTLRGIDNAIRRLWVMAHRSRSRQYDVWVVSDHGQETSTPYFFAAGREINESVNLAIQEVFRPSNSDEHIASASGEEMSRRAVQSVPRAAWLSPNWLAAKLFGEFDDGHRAELGQPQVAALGPIGHVYLNRDSSHSQRVAIARRLVDCYHVPLSLVPTTDHNHAVMAITHRGDFLLPEHAEQFFGDHLFKSEVVNDALQLCSHPDAGEIILSGWAPGTQTVSFPRQHGAHAGFGPNETDAFALLPSDVHIDVRPGNYLRPEDLHDAAKHFLAESTRPRPIVQGSTRRLFRVMTYNVHACLGMDGLRSPKRIARVIAQSGAEIVALQELDALRARSGHLYQAEEIARHLEMEFNFHPAWQVADEKYGDAILSRFPMRQIKMGQLPNSKTTREPRGALTVQIDLPCGYSIQVVNTHLSIYPSERYIQAQALLRDGWIDEAWMHGPAILLGDFNASPASRTFKLLEKRLHHIRCHVSGVVNTWPSPKSLISIDHIFTSFGDFHCHDARPISSTKAAAASDHLPLIADLEIVPRN